MATEAQTTTISQDEKLLAALSYIYLLSFIILLIKRDSVFVQFHAKQGVVLCLISIVLWFVPILGWFLNFLVLVAIIFGFVVALNGSRWRMPVIGDLAEKIRL